jgi:hypothetical protein
VTAEFIQAFALDLHSKSKIARFLKVVSKYLKLLELCESKIAITDERKMF